MTWSQFLLVWNLIGSKEGVNIPNQSQSEVKQNQFRITFGTPVRLLYAGCRNNYHFLNPFGH